MSMLFLLRRKLLTQKYNIIVLR